MLPSGYPTAGAPLNHIFCAEQVRALRSVGVEVGVAFPDFRSLRTARADGLVRSRLHVTSETEDGVPTVRFHGWLAPRTHSGRAYIRWFLRLAERFSADFWQPDLVHAHNCLWAGAAAARLKADAGIPYCLTEHSSVFARGRVSDRDAPAIRDALRGADAVLSVSRALARSLEPYAASRTIEVVPNTVDTEIFRPPDAQVAGDGTYTVAAVAGLRPHKAIGCLIAAFAEAFGDDPRTRLLIAGDGPERRALGAQAALTAARRRVRLLGALHSREQVRELLWQADVLVVPSLVETFGVVLVEAMSTGLPVVATASGGPDEIVTRETGLLVPPGDVPALAGALRRMRAEPGRFVPEAIRAYAVERYDFGVVGARLAGIYRQVLGGGGHAPEQSEPGSR